MKCCNLGFVLSRVFPIQGSSSLGSSLSRVCCSLAFVPLQGLSHFRVCTLQGPASLGFVSLRVAFSRVCYLSLACYFLFLATCSLFLASCFLILASCYLLPATYYFLLAICYFLLAPCFLLIATCYLLHQLDLRLSSCYLLLVSCSLLLASF